jgi:hypothetical protein
MFGWCRLMSSPMRPRPIRAPSSAINFHRRHRSARLRGFPQWMELALVVVAIAVSPRTACMAQTCTAGKYSNTGSAPCTICPSDAPFSRPGAVQVASCSGCGSGCDGTYGKFPCKETSWTLWYDTAGVETANRLAGAKGARLCRASAVTSVVSLFCCGVSVIINERGDCPDPFREIRVYDRGCNACGCCLMPVA